jgi:hypothetical protein
MISVDEKNNSEKGQAISKVIVLETSLPKKRAKCFEGFLP